MKDYKTGTTNKSVSYGIRLDGKLIGNKYTLGRRLDVASSNMFMSSIEGLEYVIKLIDYSENRMEICKRLKDISSKYLLQLYDFGVEGEFIYEVYPYMKSKNLEDEKPDIKDEKIIAIIAENVNEGLNLLHNKGIAHGDIKPSNLFWNNEKTGVVIGDFDISVLLDNQTSDIKEYTKEYYPISGHTYIKSIESDYASLGVTLLDIYTGNIHFEGMSISEIENEWKNGLKIKDEIKSTRVKELIYGLVHSDGEKRCGYNDVKTWCNGGVIIPRTEERLEKTKKENIKPLIVCIDGNVIEKASSLDELVTKMMNNWENVKKRFFGSRDKNVLLIEFIKQFDENIAENVKEIMQKDESDAAIAKIVRLLSGTREICYKDVRYKSLEEFVNSLNAEVIDYEFISYIKRGLHRNCDNSDDDAKICKGIDECIDKSCGDDKLLYYLIQKGFSKNKSLHIGSYEVKELSDFIEYIIKNGLNEEIEKMDFMNIIAWLYINGHEIDVKKVQEVRSIYELRNLL